MEFLKDTEHFGETFKKGEDDNLGTDVEKFLGKLLPFFERNIFNRISKRVNFLLTRINDQKLEIIADGNSGKDEDGNWRVRETGGNLIIEERISGTWTERFRIDTNGNVGIGTGSPAGRLHIYTGSAGTIAPSTRADELIIEGSDHTGITIYAPDNKQAHIYFGSDSDDVGALVRWEHDSDLMTIGTAKSGGGIQFITGDSVNAMKLTSGKHLILEGTFSLLERAAAVADVATYGQIWVKNTTPNELMFTDDAGSDMLIAPLAYGEISVVSNAVETAIASQNVYVQVTIFDTNGENFKTTPDHTNDHLTITKAGRYFISCSITLNSIGGSGSTAEMEVKKNNGNVRVGSLHVDRTLAGGGAESGAITLTGIANLAGPVSATRTTYAFVDSNPDTITDSSNNFVNDGFLVGQKLTVTGTANNNGDYTIATVVAGTITLIAADTLAAESAGASMTLKGSDTIEVWIKNETNTQNYVVEDITLSLMQIGG